GRAMTWLQHLDRTTGECLLAAAKQRSAITDWHRKFANKLRVSCLGGAGAHDRYEREYLRELRSQADGWHRLPVGCEIHLVAGCHGKTFAPVNPMIMGQIHWALAINEGTSFNRFQRIAKNIVKERIVFRQGWGPLNLKKPLRDIVAIYFGWLCAARGSRLLAKRLALSFLPNGDWRKTDCVEVCIPVGAAYDDA
ncbi:unnamed protein product, partial [Prorocentrum cordatum]